MDARVEGAANPAAPVAAAAFRAAVRAGRDLRGIATELHAVVRKDLPSPCRLPTWLGCLDSDTGAFQWLSLGHAPAVIVRAESHRVLETGTPTVGDGPLFTAPDPHEDVLEIGDVLAVVSDGVHEAMDTARKRLGSDGVVDTLRGSGDGPLEEAMQALRETLARGRESPDDRSALFLRRVGPADE